MKRLLIATAIFGSPIVATAAICRHNGAFAPAWGGSPCPECQAEGAIPAGYKWYNAHLAPSGFADGHESGQETPGAGPAKPAPTPYPYWQYYQWQRPR